MVRNHETDNVAQNFKIDNKTRNYIIDKVKWNIKTIKL